MNTKEIDLGWYTVPVYTSNYASRLIDDKCLCISISRTVPSWFNKPYLVLKNVQPTSDVLNTWNKSEKTTIDKIQYITNYYYSTIKYRNMDSFEDYLKWVVKLAINNPNSIIRPEKIVLLCYESPEMFCHRLILTIYLDMVMGYKILELGHDNVFQCEDAKIIRIILKKLEQYTKGECIK